MVLNFIKDQNCIYLSDFQKYVRDILQSICKERDNYYSRILHLANLNLISLPQKNDEYIISKCKEISLALLAIKNTNQLYFDNLLKIMSEYSDRIQQKIDEISLIEIPKNTNISPYTIQEICNSFNEYCNKKFKETEQAVIEEVKCFMESINNMNNNIDETSKKSYNSYNHQILSNESRYLLKNLKAKVQNLLACLRNEIEKSSNESEIKLNTKQKEQKYANHISLIKFMDSVLSKISKIESECMEFQEMISNSTKTLKDSISDIRDEITKIRTAVTEAEEIYVS